MRNKLATYADEGMSRIYTYSLLKIKLSCSFYSTSLEVISLNLAKGNV